MLHLTQLGVTETPTTPAPGPGYIWAADPGYWRRARAGEIAVTAEEAAITVRRPTEVAPGIRRVDIAPREPYPEGTRIREHRDSAVVTYEIKDGKRVRVGVERAPQYKECEKAGVPKELLDKCFQEARTKRISGAEAAVSILQAKKAAETAKKAAEGCKTAGLPPHLVPRCMELAAAGMPPEQIIATLQQEEAAKQVAPTTYPEGSIATQSPVGFRIAIPAGSMLAGPNESVLKNPVFWLAALGVAGAGTIAYLRLR